MKTVSFYSFKNCCILNRFVIIQCYFLSISDYIINEAAKILRLLHIKDLRELQSQINHAIVAVQALTANPKTDSRLGKIGRS